MMKRLWWLIGAGCAIVLVVAIIAFFVLRPHGPIPGDIKNQLLSTLILPDKTAGTIHKGSPKYDKTDKLLTFTMVYAGTEMVISEQPTPEQFVDIPTVYTKLVDGLNNYESFDAAIGTVHLTKPTQLKGKQAAVMNSKGTLLFAKPDKLLTSTQWRVFFNNLQVAQ